MKVVICQINPTLGAIEKNKQLIIQKALEAKSKQNADLVIFPAASLLGANAGDLEGRIEVNEALHKAIVEIEETLDFPVVFGVTEGTCEVINLPEDTIFQDVVGSNILYEETWQTDSAIMLHLGAVPFHSTNYLQDQQLYSFLANKYGKAFIQANLVGAQDENIYPGGSFVLDHQGNLIAQAKEFVAEDLLVDLATPLSNGSSPRPVELDSLSKVERQRQAIVLGIKDYLAKNNLSGVLLGLSGGIDSALVLALAVEALGADKVHALMMPYKYTAAESLEDARAQAEMLGVSYQEIAIAPMVEAFKENLGLQVGGGSLTEQNLQARVRANILMAHSNEKGSLVLSTDNKSEVAVGYSTLYGDMVGGYAPIKDLLKTEVYELANWLNKDKQVIPERVITRLPTAELSPEQLDTDSLPDYPILDAVLADYLAEDVPFEQLGSQAGASLEDIKRTLRLIRISEHKRAQAAPGVRLTQSYFGADWDYPITASFSED